VRIAIVCDNYSRTYRIEAQFTAQRYFASTAPTTPLTRNRPA
jgi:hypothetical protein